MIGYYGEYDGKNRNTNIDKAVIVAQPHGTLFNLILDDKGQIANKVLATSGVAIYDIGFKTNDGIVFKNLEPVGRLTLHSKNGMYVAYEEIRSRINQMFNGLEVKLYEIPEVVKSRQIRGTSIDGVINDAFHHLASNIISEIKSKWDDAWEIENIVFTGGGAELLKPYLMQAYSCTFPPNCQTSNAEGMLKYAIRLWGRETS
jgi:plasmid segregation protein ParM